MRKYMEPNSITKDSIEELVCKRMDGFKTHKMTDSEMKMLMSFLLGDHDKAREVAQDALKQAWPGAAAQKRMEVLMGRKMDSRVALMIAMHAQDIASCMLYTYYCEWKLQQIGHTGEFDIDVFCNQIFPMGMFADEDVHLLWDEQKVNYQADGGFEGLDFGPAGDNLIDYRYAAQSFIDIKELETEV